MISSDWFVVNWYPALINRNAEADRYWSIHLHLNITYSLHKYKHHWHYSSTCVILKDEDNHTEFQILPDSIRTGYFVFMLSSTVQALFCMTSIIFLLFSLLPLFETSRFIKVLIDKQQWNLWCETPVDQLTCDGRPSSWDSYSIWYTWSLLTSTESIHIPWWQATWTLSRLKHSGGGIYIKHNASHPSSSDICKTNNFHNYFCIFCTNHPFFGEEFTEFMHTKICTIFSQ